MVTPLTATVGWLREYSRGLDAGLGDAESRRAACRATGIKGKSYARCDIRGYRLTVPVEGGSSVLKRGDADPLLSNHGKWRREHLGAWNAAYGRTPYFIHLYPEIEEVYETSSGMKLEAFNSRLLEVASGWLDFDSLRSGDSKIIKISDEIKSLADDGLSVFDLLFRIGPDAIFALYTGVC